MEFRRKGIKGNENMKITVYDVIDNGRPVKKIIMEHAEILGGTFRDFVGTLNDNGNLIRKFTIAIPPRLVDYLTENGIPTGRWIPADTAEEDMDDYDPILPVKINYSYYKSPTIETKNGIDGQSKIMPENELHTLQGSTFEDALVIGRVVNGVTRMKKPYTTIYLDHASFVLPDDRRPQIEEEVLREYGSTLLDSHFQQEEPLPFEE